MKILVTGAAGLLGSAVVKAGLERGHRVVRGVRDRTEGVGGDAERGLSERGLSERGPSERGPSERGPSDPGVAAFDITDADAVARVVAGLSPDYVVHCAGYTDVDGAEADEERVMAANADGTRLVARAAADVGSALLYVSTDYVFDGVSRRPRRPDDPTHPLNVYGRSKKAGEEEVMRAGGRWMIVRTSWLYGSGGRNFVDAVLEAGRKQDRVEVVSDQTGRPTWTGSLAPALVELLEWGVAGDRSGAGEASGRILHLTDRGRATWYELARDALEMEGVDTELVPVSSEAWGATAPRPAYSVLDIEEAEGILGRRMPEWEDSLQAYLEERRRDRSC